MLSYWIPVFGTGFPGGLTLQQQQAGPVPIESTWLGGSVIRFVRITALHRDVKFRVKMDGHWYYFVNRGRGLIEFVRDDIRPYPRRWTRQPSVRLMGAQAVPGTTEILPELEGCIVIGWGFVAQSIGGLPSFSAGRVTEIEHAPGCTRRRPTRSKFRPEFLVSTATSPARLTLVG